MKNASSRVDVVMASMSPEAREDADTGLAALIAERTARQVETVAVAPDPNQRIIILAPSKKRGQVEAEALGVTPVAIVTPRTPDAARGITADLIHETDDLSAEQRAELMPHVLPALTEGA